MTFGSDDLLDHLKRLRWEVKSHGENTFLSEHDSPEGPIKVFLRMDRNWLIASVVPFLQTSGNNSFELSRWLLRQNWDMPQTKFAYDEDGDVVLTAELPTESLDFSEVQTALTGLIDYTRAHRGTLRRAAGG